MIYRATITGSVVHPESGIDVTLTPEAEYDDEDAYVRALIRAHPGLFKADNTDPVERATAAPGEKRTVKKRG